MATQVKEKPVFREIDSKGKLRLNLHGGQTRVWDSEKRIIAMICGSQGGKTVLGPHWLYREIAERGTGDYLAVTSSYPLLSKKMLPELLYVFLDLLHLGTYNKFDRILTFHQEKKSKEDNVMFPDADMPTRILIGSAQNAESLEAATVKGAWLDECGQKDFRLDAFEAVRRRTAIHKARMLMTTTVYCLGWLKTEIYDEWAQDKDGEIDVIQFDSTMNPAFPEDEFEYLRSRMPAWKFDMQHRGRFTQPAGLIYDSFIPADHIVKPFEIPDNWARYVGHDFGTNNTAALWVAQDVNTGNFYVYREYWKGGLSTFEHVSNFLSMSEGERIARRVGGAQQEEGWRGDFTQAGWRIDKPMIKSVEAGIQKVYSLHKLGKLYVFNNCFNYLDQKQSYSRELDDRYHPTERIENKESYHLMDAERYILSEFSTPRVAEGGKGKVWFY